MFLLVLALCCRSTCQFRGNSKKSNHMLSATSHIGLEFLTKFLNMSKFQNRLILLYQSLPLQLLVLGALIFSISASAHESISKSTLVETTGTFYMQHYCAQANSFKNIEKLGSISLCFEKMSKLLKAILKKNPCKTVNIFFKNDRFLSPNLHLFKKILSITVLL